jgi:hypothetical protein
MLARGCGGAARSTLTLIRELFLILVMGVLGSQLLITLNGGAPIGIEAQAATHFTTQSPALIFSVTFDFEPGNPAALRAVYLHLTFPTGIDPEILIPDNLKTGISLDSFSCHAEGNASWYCPILGLKIVELEEIVLSGS